jgi:hypothetical protein
MKIVPALLLLLLTVSCSSTSQQGSQTAAAPGPASPGGSGTPVELSEADRAQVQTAVRTQLGNEQASFRTMIGQRDATNAVIVCGYVNPGSGDTPFVGTLGGGSFAVTDIGGPTERTIAVQRACHARGIYI